MMINRIQAGTNFGSTKIKLSDEEFNSSIFKVMDKYVSPVKDYFDVKGIDAKTPQKMADEIELNQAALMIKDKELVIVGKDGGQGGADTFIGRILTEKFPNATFTDDVAPIEIEGEPIDLTLGGELDLLG